MHLIASMPDWIDIVRDQIKKKQEEIAALETGRTGYTILAKAVDAHRGNCDAKIELTPAGSKASITVPSTEALLPILRGISSDVSNALEKAKLRRYARVPAVSQHGAYWPTLNLTWRLKDGRALHVHFTLSTAGASDLKVDSREETSTWTHYTVSPADGSEFIPGAGVPSGVNPTDVDVEF